MEEIILVGAGWHSKAMIDLLLESEKYKPIGILDNHKPVGYEIDGYKVIGTDDEAQSYFDRGIHQAVMCIAMPCSLRQRVTEYYRNIGFEFPTLISKSATLARNCKIGKGVAILSGAAVGALSVVQDNCTINSNAVVTHGDIIGEYSNLGPNCTILGSVVVGKNTLIGANSVLIQNVKTGCNVVVGAGSVVLKSLPSNITAVGNPARVIKVNGERV